MEERVDQQIIDLTELIEEAAEARVPVQFEYTTQSGARAHRVVTPREDEPVWTSRRGYGEPYLIGTDSTRDGALRQFALDRIENAVVLIPERVVTRPTTLLVAA